MMCYEIDIRKITEVWYEIDEKYWRDYRFLCVFAFKMMIDDLKG